MPRNANSSMRKMAVTGLALIGLMLGGLGTVGCDQFSAAQLALVAASDNGNPVREMTIDAAAAKSDASSKIINNGPPRR